MYLVYTRTIILIHTTLSASGFVGDLQPLHLNISKSARRAHNSTLYERGRQREREERGNKKRIISSKTTLAHMPSRPPSLEIHCCYQGCSCHPEHRNASANIVGHVFTYIFTDISALSFDIVGATDYRARVSRTLSRRHGTAQEPKSVIRVRTDASGVCVREG